MAVDDKILLSLSLDIGEQMLKSGAEIYRVEDCIKRICTAYGAVRTDVFTITSSIVATLQSEDGDIFTQTRRIKKYNTDLTKLDKLNDLSREVCLRTPDLDTLKYRIELLDKIERYPSFVQCAAYALVSGSFTLFFGGTYREGAVSFAVGALLFLVVHATGKSKVNTIFAGILTSFFASLLAFMAYKTGLAEGADKIIIGNIMLLIPGLGITNALRDMINGDTMAGMLRFLEACLVALGIAAGYFIAAFLVGVR